MKSGHLLHLLYPEHYTVSVIISYIYKIDGFLFL